MTTVTISKKEYDELLAKRLRYEYLRQVIESDLFAPPPTQSRKAALGALKATGRYNRQFLESLKRGLRRSSHFRRP